MFGGGVDLHRRIKFLKRGRYRLSDAVELVRIIKKAAVEAVEAEKPAAVCFGRVIGIAPLKIMVEQKLVLGEKQLILTKAVTDHYADVYFDFEDGKRGLIYNGLKEGEEVILLRAEGGQRFIVIDRLCPTEAEGEGIE